MNQLNDRETRVSHELAELYYKMDTNCRYISNLDIERLYGEASKNPNIHYKALELNSKRHKRVR